MTESGGEMSLLPPCWALKEVNLAWIFWSHLGYYVKGDFEVSVTFSLLPTHPTPFHAKWGDDCMRHRLRLDRVPGEVDVDAVRPASSSQSYTQPLNKG